MKESMEVEEADEGMFDRNKSGYFLWVLIGGNGGKIARHF